ncbi:glycoside hydrolase family 13 protein [Roseimarinus sediminis]|jgi:glycosidase|uniref:glycoside hydrolase family 13 protein n=1 Tax=Roseimarinus sediminis TaxID=1610899 RepID=UPI003D203DD0
MKKLLSAIAGLLLSLSILAGTVNRVEPPSWWVGFQNPELQLMIHGEAISQLYPQIDYEGITVTAVTRVENPNYLFVDLNIAPETKAGTLQINFTADGEIMSTVPYELKARDAASAHRDGFNTSDVIYLITPDRFVNGDVSNDELPQCKEGIDRSDRDGRHGGDIRGIINSLDYLQQLGFTAVWLNPVLENNMTSTSYHGYSTTDFYKVDPRYGSNEEYLELDHELDKRGMKLIMDMIFNHCGSEHWWMDDMPMSDWINHYPSYEITSHRRTVNQDPNASQYDTRAMTDGWFVPTMPDLNQRNPYMANYLIQNSIWWIEYAGLEGIRQDTWPYPDKHMMSEWTWRLLAEYPNFNIVGEEWSLNPAIVSYWQKGKHNADGYQCHLPSLMDFPLQAAVSRGLNNEETWDRGLIEIYEALSNDFLYPDAGKLVVFPDNHDMSRFYMQVNQDVDLLKMGLAFYLTSRGIPQIYYGTELLLTHEGDHHGNIRADYPGGWDNDPVNAFTGKGLSKEQTDVRNYLSKIQNWRKNQKVIHHGSFMHFVPFDGFYTYFRYTDEEAVMVIISKNEEEKNINTSRFTEIMSPYSSGREIITGKQINQLETINVPARSAMIIELKK